MFFSTFLKFTLCAVLTSVAQVNAQVVCDDPPTALLEDCNDVIEKLRSTNRPFTNDGGQANFTVGTCTGRVQFKPGVEGINSPTFSADLEPIIQACTSDGVLRISSQLISGQNTNQDGTF